MTNCMSKSMLIRKSLISVILLACSSAANSQINIVDANKIFSQIQVEQRSKLVERLNLFIQLERTNKWDESYLMISETFKNDIRGGYSVIDYRREPYIKIDKFVPDTLQSVDSSTLYTAVPTRQIAGHYFILGCGSNRSDVGKSEKLIEAYWEHGNWYFSFMQFLGMHEAVECTKRTKKKK